MDINRKKKIEDVLEGKGEDSDDAIEETDEEEVVEGDGASELSKAAEVSELSTGPKKTEVAEKIQPNKPVDQKQAVKGTPQTKTNQLLEGPLQAKKRSGIMGWIFIIICLVIIIVACVFLYLYYMTDYFSKAEKIDVVSLATGVEQSRVVFFDEVISDFCVEQKTADEICSGTLNQSICIKANEIALEKQKEFCEAMESEKGIIQNNIGDLQENNDVRNYYEALGRLSYVSTESVAVPTGLFEIDVLESVIVNKTDLEGNLLVIDNKTVTNETDAIKAYVKKRDAFSTLASNELDKEKIKQSLIELAKQNEGLPEGWETSEEFNVALDIYTSSFITRFSQGCRKEIQNFDESSEQNNSFRSAYSAGYLDYCIDFLESWI